MNLVSEVFPDEIIELNKVQYLCDMLTSIGKYASEIEERFPLGTLETLLVKDYQVSASSDDEPFYFLPNEDIEEKCSEIALLCVTHKESIHPKFEDKLRELDKYRKLFKALETNYYADF